MHSFAMDPRKLMQDLMKAEGLNPNSLSAATKNKTKQPQIHRFISGVSKEPKRSTLAPVAGYFGVPVEAFFDSKVADDVYRDRLGGSPSPASPVSPNQPQPDVPEVAPLHQNPTIALIVEMADKLLARQQEQLLSVANLLSGPLGDRLAMSFSVADPKVPAPSAAPASGQKRPA